MSEKQTNYVEDLLAQLQNELSRDILSEEINALLRKCSLNLVTVATLPDMDIKPLLATIKHLLTSNISYDTLNYDYLLDIVDKLVPMVAFDDVLEIYGVDDLIEALNSGIDPLTVAACKVIEHCQPKGLFATSNIIDILLDILFDEKVGNDKVTESIEKALEKLSSDELIRRRLFDNNLPFLMNVKSRMETISFVRLIDFLAVEFPFINGPEFKAALFCFTKDEVLKSVDDILVFVELVNYFTKLLVDIRNQDKYWALKNVKKTLPVFAQLFEDKENYPDIRTFSKNRLLQLFAEISRIDEDEFSLFKAIDKDFLKIGSETRLVNEWLQLIDPHYLIRNHKALVKDYFHISGYSMEILRNLAADEECFNAIKDKFDSEIILKLPYLEQMQLVETLTRFGYTSKFLLSELPKVMAGLIGEGSADAIVDLETTHYRNSALRNLLDIGEKNLSVWYEPLVREYSVAINGKNYSKNGETKIADDYIA
ncbi:Hsm3p [Saccharomyces cerevisiae x Saccharomyces kudriavzevii VIN7]|uniref:DNA mismatch repair protein HSM3 n=1 Tax=Saccharomyces cerevisiae x Saccharomyces kudriavzevii (strain VIN7) TaxID=1095631 RepID=H0GRN9_SACCK|nr:Hsm3p [Saccharomyces cerevisiae x Saccharomyces kudriavzevii VIN7]